jgi:hypothetical protein
LALTSIIPSFFSQEDKVFGKDFRHWIKEYWKSFLYDAEKRSKGKVYMLPTNLEMHPQTETDFTIEQKKAILLPVGKWISVVPSDTFKQHAIRMRDLAKEKLDAYQDLNVFVDGELVSDQTFRTMSDYFDIDYKWMGICDAYWLFIKPYTLELGEHKISTFVSCSSGQTQISLNYNLSIS